MEQVVFYLINQRSIFDKLLFNKLKEIPDREIEHDVVVSGAGVDGDAPFKAK